MIFVSILVATLVGAALALTARALVLPRLRASARIDEIGAYGFTAPIAAPVVKAPSRPLTSLAGYLGDKLAPRLGVMKEKELRAELLAAGMYRTPPRMLLGYRAIGAFGLMTLGWVLGSSASP